MQCFLMLLLYYFFPFLKRLTSGLKFCTLQLGQGFPAAN
ncbi:hypothetical protein T01_11930, partial [Trichinella spiralis]